MKNKLIGVLMGGISREREISLRSGRNVLDALLSKGYRAIAVDVISANCHEQLKTAGIDVAYNILHGALGEDGEIQKILEDLQIPYTGPGVKCSEICIDKIRCKEELLKNGLPTPPFELPGSAEKITFASPLVIKAAKEGSSFGVSIVKNQEDLASTYNKTLREFGQPVFVEKYIKGREITVGVLQDGHKILPLPILELVPKNEFYDFEAKYTPGGTEFILPARLAPALTAEIQAVAAKVFRVLKCAGGIRVDFIVDQQDAFYILEVNTVPGMTAQSDLPAEAAAVGITFADLTEKILLTAALNKF